MLSKTDRDEGRFEGIEDEIPCEYDNKPTCPRCGGRRWRVDAWWDDEPDEGGACIGDIYECKTCGYERYE